MSMYSSDSLAHFCCLTSKDDTVKIETKISSNRKVGILLRKLYLEPSYFMRLGSDNDFNLSCTQNVSLFLIGLNPPVDSS